MSDLPIKLTRGVPPPESFPTAQLSECATAVLAEQSDTVLQYGKPRGHPGLRAIIAQDTGADEARIIIGQGSLQLQDLCARMMIRPGDVAYVEQPSYDRTLTILRRAGAQVVGFPLEEDGPDVGTIEARLKGGERPVLFYIIPDFQNPSGSVLPSPKRRRIAELAQEYGFWIIEDIPYRRLRYRGEDLPTLFELAPERVIQMSSYSKLICPGLRVGYAVVPEPLASDLAKMAEETYISASYLTQAIAAEFIGRGWLEPQISRLKALYRPRLDAMLGALEAHMADGGTWSKPDGGFFISMTLNTNVNADDLLRKAREANLLLTDGRGFFTDNADGSGDRFIRLPFCALTPEEIEAGVIRLTEVVCDLQA
jgi:2-aminoadipate transaminase